MAADFKALDKNTQGALIAGGLATILSFLTAYVSGDSTKVNGISYGGGGISAWHGFGVLGILLVIVATAIVAIKAFASDSLPDGVPWNLAAFGGAALGLVLLILRALTYSYGHPGWSGYLLWIAVAALTYFAFNLFKASGDTMPEFNRKDTPPAA